MAAGDEEKVEATRIGVACRQVRRHGHLAALAAHADAGVGADDGHLVSGAAHPLARDLKLGVFELVADEEVCRVLERLPDERFEAPVDVSEAVARLA